MDNKKEAGRTMVEMLGVLAIVGVLSVMGIAGYMVAMQTYRANEVVEQAMRLATLASSQLSLGESVTLSDLDNGPCTFSIDTHPEDGQFLLTATGISEPVQKRVSSMASDLAEISTNANGSVTFTFNNDLQPIGNTSSDSEAKMDTGSCENENVYLSYMDEPCDTITPMTGDCKKNSDCTKKGEYCEFKKTGTSCLPTEGVCTDIGSYVSHYIRGLGTVRVSSSTMTWWAAENWCKAQGKSLIEISKFGCYKSNSSDLVAEGSEYLGGGCCVKGMECDWAGNWFQPGKKENYSDILYSLEQAFGHTQTWWAASRSSATACVAFSVNSTYGTFGTPNRANLYYALCK